MKVFAPYRMTTLCSRVRGASVQEGGTIIGVRATSIIGLQKIVCVCTMGPAKILCVCTMETQKALMCAPWKHKIVCVFTMETAKSICMWTMETRKAYVCWQWMTQTIVCVCTKEAQKAYVCAPMMTPSIVCWRLITADFQYVDDTSSLYAFSCQLNIQFNSTCYIHSCHSSILVNDYLHYCWVNVTTFLLHVSS